VTAKPHHGAGPCPSTPAKAEPLQSLTIQPVTILAASSPGEVRIALTDRWGTLLDYRLWRPGAPDGVGDEHLGRVIKRVPAMAGVFVALAGAEGFLPDTAGGAKLAEGALIRVRVSRAALGGKGPRLQALAGETPGGPPRLLQPAPHPLLQIAAHYPEAAVRVDDPALAAQLHALLGPRLTCLAAAFDAGIEDQAAALAAPDAALPGGARATFHPTPALTAIDLDAGAATAARAPKGMAQEALNRALIPALARQIRLRNLSGAILIDFAGMKSKKRATLAPALAAALAADPLRPRLLGFTALGFAEILRPRVHPPLHEYLSGPHAAGLQALRAAMRDAAARPATPLALLAAPAVIAAIEADTLARADFARRAGRVLTLRSAPGLALDAWRIVPS